MRRWAGLAPLLLIVSAAYIFFASAGRMLDWPTHTTFLDDLAEGFRHGHLHMAVEPAPELLSKANPYDPSYRPLWYWDASLYKGHYYLYWGPVPALLLAAFKILFRVSAPIADQYPVFALALLQAIAGTMLIDRIARRLFVELPFVCVAMAVLAFSFAAPTSYNLGRPSVYEAAILGAQVFLLFGLVLGFDAVWAARAGRPGGRWRLVAAGAAWGLALGCRLSIAPALAVLVPLTAVFVGLPADPARWRRRLRAAIEMGLPLVATVAGLLLYNKLRFDSWLDFGRARQMTWLSLGASTAYVPYNLYSYLLRPLVARCTFPFLFIVESMGARAFSFTVKLPPGYDIGEPVGGVLTTVPWTWLGIAALALGVPRFWRALRAGARRDDRTASAFWLSASLVSSAVLSSVVLLWLYTATNRYAGDFINQTMLLATMGAWWLRSRCGARAWLRRTVDAVTAVLTLLTVALGIVLGFQGQYSHVKLYNPTLMNKLEKKLSVCGASDHKR